MQSQVFQTERLKRLTLYSIITLLILLGTLVVMLQTVYIQTQITNYVTKKLSEKLKSDIHIDNVKISILKGLKLEGVLVKDIQNDTMLYIGKLYTLPSGIPNNFNNLSFRYIEIHELIFDLHEIKKDTLNLDYIIDALSDKNDTSASSDFRLHARSFKMHNSVFKYKEIEHTSNFGMNYEDMFFSDINIDMDDVDIHNDVIKTKINKVSLKEKGGIVVKNISTASNTVSSQIIKAKDLKVYTEKSSLEFDSINLQYPPQYVFSAYKKELKLNTKIRKGSFLSYDELLIFLQDSVKAFDKIHLSGGFAGKYTDFKLSDFYLDAENYVSVQTNAHIKNFAQSKNLAFDIKDIELSSNLKNFAGLKIPKIIKSPIQIPEELQKAEIISYKGKAKGTVHDFVSEGYLAGDFGTLNLQTVAKTDTNNITEIKGSLFAENIDAKSFVENSDIGQISFKQNFTLSFLKDKSFNIVSEGIIDNFQYKKHNYKNIKSFVSLKDKKSDGIKLQIDRPELQAELNGKVDFSEKIPEIYLKANILHADLQAMKISKESINLSTELIGNFQGITLDDFKGKVQLTKPLKLEKNGNITSIKKLMLTGKSQVDEYSDVKFINLESDIADAQLKSTGSISASIQSLKHLFDPISGINEQEQTAADTALNTFLDFKIYIKKTDMLTKQFFPEINLKKQSTILGYYEPSINKFNVSFNSDELKYKDIVVKDFYLVSYTRENKLFVGTGGSSVKPSEKFYAENFNLDGELKKDTVLFNISWNNFKDSANYSADIAGELNIKKNKQNKLSYHCKFSNSEIVLNNVLWNFKDASLKIDSSHISISDFKIYHDDEEVYLDGNVSEYEGDILFANFKNLDLSNFQSLLPDNLKLNGKLSGFSTVAGIYDKPLLFTKDSIVGLKINDMDFGNFYIKSTWDNAQNNIHANAYNLKGKRRFMNDTIYGNYYPKSKTLDFTVDIRSMLLKTFKEYYQDFASFNQSAFVSGIVKIKGDIKDLDISGDLSLKQTTAYVKYLNTFNNLSEMKINFDKQNIKINKTVLLAQNGKGKGYIMGNIHHNKFSDFYLDLDMQTNNYEMLNIIPTDSSYFYGRAFASGNINISGPANNLFMSANLQTEKNTNIFIPISSDKTYNEENGFVSFKTDTSQKKASFDKSLPEPDISGFSMNMKVDVTQDAMIQILPGEGLGNIYTEGKGGIRLVLRKNGEFNMFGTYYIAKGNYLFNMENIIQKKFLIKDGSSIDWFGEPENAKVNIKAAYRLNNVSLSDLTLSSQETRRVKVDCEIDITEKLLNPEFKLNILFPGNLMGYKAKIDNLTRDELNEQFLSLLLLGVFQPLPGISQENIAGRTASGEILSNQLTTFLKKIKYVDLNFKYDPGNNYYTDEYTLGVSKSLMGDRLELKGNFGVGGKEAQQTKATNYIGEFELEVKLNKKGTMRANVYNKANDKIENDGNYTQGVGFIWRRDFDRLFPKKGKKKKNNRKIIPPLKDSIQ